MTNIVLETTTYEDIRREEREEFEFISREAKGLCELSKEINSLIEDSRPVLLDIEKNTELSLDRVERGCQNIIETVALHKKKSTKSIIIVGLITTLGLASGGSLGALAGSLLVGKAVIGGLFGMFSLGTLFGGTSIILTNKK